METSFTDIAISGNDYANRDRSLPVYVISYTPMWMKELKNKSDGSYHYFACYMENKYCKQVTALSPVHVKTGKMPQGTFYRMSCVLTVIPSFTSYFNPTLS